MVKRSTCCMNIKFFFKQETEKKKVVESQMRSELQSHIVGLEDPGMNEKFNKSEPHKTGNTAGATKSPVAN